MGAFRDEGLHKKRGFEGATQAELARLLPKIPPDHKQRYAGMMKMRFIEEREREKEKKRL